jgi:hypothetical protein
VVSRDAVAVALVAAAMFATACGGSVAEQPSPPVAASPSSVLPSLPATSPTPPFTPSEAREAASPDPGFDYGFVIQVTAAGIHPQWLVAVCCRPIIWENMTSAAVTIVLDHQDVNSGPIAPGAAWVFTPRNVQSIAYHTAADASVKGVLQVNQPIES